MQIWDSMLLFWFKKVKHLLKNKKIMILTCKKHSTDIYLFEHCFIILYSWLLQKQGKLLSPENDYFLMG